MDEIRKAQTIVIVASGFLQKRGAAHGMDLVESCVRQELIDSGAIRDARVCAYRWADDPDSVLRIVQRRAVEPPNYPTIRMAGYSYGAGRFVLAAAKILNRYGYPIDYLGLVDPVYRHPWLGPFLSPLLSWGIAQIKIPPNVGLVRSWYQRIDWPRGSRVVARGADTVIHETNVSFLQMGHGAIQHDAQIQRHLVEDLIGKPDA